ncbi:MAG: hypothetical protein WCN98_04670 [Verrucomicrobiaceae bacterium]
MSTLPQPRIDDDLNTYTLATASAAAGCALGLLFGRGMERKSSSIAALTLLAAGALIAGPTLSGLIFKAANRPATKRGSRKRLDGIRNGALPAGGDFYSMEDDLLN